MNGYAIFHFGGHAGENCLLLESALGKAVEVDLRELLGFWGRKGGLLLVFLNGCSTRAQISDLLEAGVSAVVATARPIDDRVAREVAVEFYTSTVSFRFLAGSSMVVRCYANDNCRTLLVRCAATNGCCGDEAKPEGSFASKRRSVH